MILGITGSFGCGKSSVLTFFSARCWKTFDADRVCKELYLSDPELKHAVLERWSCGDPEGRIDFAELGRRVFACPAELEALCSLVYPRLEKKLDEFIGAARNNGTHCACELPLLYEAGFAAKFDAILTVWSQPSLRMERLRRFRGFDPEEFHRREAMQSSPLEKLERADFGVINNGSPEELHAQLEQLFPAEMVCS